MANCAIRWCRNNSRYSSYKKDGITFHRFPKDPNMKEKWINATRRENWWPTQYSVVCSRHFTKDCFHFTKNASRRRMFDTALPTLHLPITGNIDPENENSSSSSDSIQETTKKKSNIEPSVLADLSEFISLPKTHLENIEIKAEPSGNEYVNLTITSSKESQPTAPKAKPKTVDENLSQCSSITKKRLCRRILQLKTRIDGKNKLIQRLRDMVRHHKKRTASLSSRVEELEKRMCEETDDVIINNKSGNRQDLLKSSTGKIVKRNLRQMEK